MIIFSAHLNPLCPFLFSTQRSLSFLPFTHLRETALSPVRLLKPSPRAPGHTCLWSPPPASRGAGPCSTPGRAVRRRDPCSYRQTLHSRLRSAPTRKPPGRPCALGLSTPFSGPAGPFPAGRRPLPSQLAALGSPSWPGLLKAAGGSGTAACRRGPASLGRTDPAGGLTHRSGARPQTDKGRQRALRSAGASGQDYNSQEAPREPERGWGGGGWAAPRRPRLPRVLWET